MHEIRRHDEAEWEDECPDSMKFAQLTEAAVTESRRWIEHVTGNKFSHREDMIKSLQDGIILCRLANGLKAGCIRRINHMHTPVAYLDNLSVFQAACRSDFRLQEAQLFDIRDLDDLDIRGTLESEEEVDRETRRRLRKVLVTLYWLGRAARTMRPDAALDLRPFEGLVDPSYFDMTSFADPLVSCPQVPHRGPPPKDKNKSAGGSIEGRPHWELKFSDWKDGKAKSNGTTLERAEGCGELKMQEFAGDKVSQATNQSVCVQTDKECEGKHQDYGVEDEEEEEAPAPPNWETFPIGGAFDPCDVDYFEGGETPRFSHTSSSSSASSFATKDFRPVQGARPIVLSAPPFRPAVSPTSALLWVSPETLDGDEMSGNFEGLLKDMERFSNVSKSQSLDCLEDFDEVGFEDGSDEESEDKVFLRGKEITEGEKRGGGRGGGDACRAATAKPVRNPSDFMEELTSLDEITRKYDPTRATSSGFHFDRPSPDVETRAVVVLQSPELLEKPRPLSAKMTDVLRQNSFGSGGSQFSRPSSGHAGSIQSTMMDRFAHDLESVLKVEQSPVTRRRVWDLELERKRMEEWNRKEEEKLKDKFQRGQDALKEKLKEDMRRAHQAERMKQLQEEKFLEEEIIEVKNRRSFAAEGTGSKFSKSSLSLFGHLHTKSGRLTKSPGLPSSYASLTDDWLNQSHFQADADNSIQRSEDLTFPADDEEEDGNNREVFEEPAWMRVVAEKVDKVILPDVKVNTATMELLPDSLSSSSESVHSSSISQSREDVTETKECREHQITGLISEAGHMEATNKETVDSHYQDRISTAGDAGIPPIPKRADSLLVATDILRSREQATYLTFDSSISNFTKNLSLPPPPPPSSLRIIADSQNLGGAVVTTSVESLLTPSSDRCSEVCTYIPPTPIVAPKKSSAASRESLSSVFPTPRSPERPEYLLSSENPTSQQQPPVDFLFAYHDDHSKRRYYWATSAPPSNCVSPLELSSERQRSAPPSSLLSGGREDKISCSGCGYCLASEQTINIFKLQSSYHPECFRCQGCRVPLTSENVAMCRSKPHCFKCFEELDRSSR